MHTVKTEFWQWTPGSIHDGGFRRMLEVARAGDAIWDPECEFVFQTFLSKPDLFRSLSLKVFLAIADAQPVAFGLTKEYLGEVWIIEIYVAIPFRRSGIGSQLLQFIVTEYSRRGNRWALVEFGSSREGSRRIAERAGFSPAGRLEYPSSDPHIEYWIRELEEN